MFVDTLAFEEYGRALEYWMSSSSSDNEDVIRELLEERIGWLRPENCGPRSELQTALVFVRQSYQTRVASWP